MIKLKYFLNKFPLITNSLVYGSLCVSAEFSQQFISKKIMTKKYENIDLKALKNYAIMGTVFYSPTLYFWYKWLDKKYIGTNIIIISKKLMLDQFIITPVLLTIFFTGMSIMEKADKPFAELKEKFLPTFYTSCCFWLPVQTINFYFIVPKFRVIYVGLCSFLWVNILRWIKSQKKINNLK